MRDAPLGRSQERVMVRYLVELWCFGLELFSRTQPRRLLCVPTDQQQKKICQLLLKKKNKSRSGDYLMHTNNCVS